MGKNVLKSFFILVKKLKIDAIIFRIINLKNFLHTNLKIIVYRWTQWPLYHRSVEQDSLKAQCAFMFVLKNCPVAGCSWQWSFISYKLCKNIHKATPPPPPQKKRFIKKRKKPAVTLLQCGIKNEKSTVILSSSDMYKQKQKQL